MRSTRSLSPQRAWRNTNSTCPSRFSDHQGNFLHAHSHACSQQPSRSQRKLYLAKKISRKRESQMAWDDEDVQRRRKRSDPILFRFPLFAVFHHEVLLRPFVVRELWDVRSGDLHLCDLVKVCARTNRGPRIHFLTRFDGRVSRSDCFSTNVCTSDRKAMLLNKVVVGRGYRMKTANGTLTEPPAGYDSVSLVDTEQPLASR